MTDSHCSQANIDDLQPFGSHTASFRDALVWRLVDWQRLPQGVRRRLRKKFAKSVAGPFDIDLAGMKFRVYPTQNYCDRIMFGRNEFPEPAEHEALRPIIFPGMMFVDIGANVGTYSVFVGAHAAGNLKLLAFEPHPETYAKLLFNLKANNLPTSGVINSAIAAEHATMKLWSDGGSNIGHTSLLREGTSNAKISVDVPVAPLLSVLEEHGIANIDLLKIDIEGFEDQALGPFFDEAPASLMPQNILIETAHQHLWKRDLMALLSDRGYSLRFSTAENELLGLTRFA